MPAQQLVLNKRLLTRALVIGTVNLPFSVVNESNKALLGLGMLESNAIAKLRRTWSIYTTFLKARLLGVMFAQKNRQDFGVKTTSSTQTPAQMTRTADDCSIGYPRVNSDATIQKIETTQTTVGGGLHFTSHGEQT